MPNKFLHLFICLNIPVSPLIGKALKGLNTKRRILCCVLFIYFFLFYFFFNFLTGRWYLQSVSVELYLNVLCGNWLNREIAGNNMLDARHHETAVWFLPMNDTQSRGLQLGITKNNKVSLQFITCFLFFSFLNCSVHLIIILISLGAIFFYFFLLSQPIFYRIGLLFGGILCY